MEMYISAYNSWPLLRINNVKTQRSGSLTFTDAISRFGKRLNLNEAYRRARRAFTGLMEQHFVVLTNGMAGGLHLS